MSRVHFVKAAAKDYPQAEVKKGEPYYWWKPFRMAKRISKERPRPSQVASSDYAIGVLMAVEALEAWEGAWEESDRDDLVGVLEELRDTEQEKFDNMPEGFQQGDTGMMIEEKISSLDEWISELQGLEFTENNEYEGETPLEQAMSTAISV